MKAYLLTAAGVIFLSVIASLLVPNGKLNKSITFVMRIICIAVLIQPITGLFKFEQTSTELDLFDYEYVASMYTINQSEYLEKQLFDKFGVQTECKVDVRFGDNTFYVDSVTVEILENSEISQQIYAYLEELKYINISVYEKSY